MPALSDEVIEEIRRRVPAYRRPLRGRFGAGIRAGVAEALAQFVDLVGDPELDRAGATPSTGRSAAASTASAARSTCCSPPTGSAPGSRGAGSRRWRSRPSVDRRTLALLAEAVFAYIDGLSALSAEGYAQAQSAAAGESERTSPAVAALLLDPAAGDEAIAGGGGGGRLGTAGPRLAALAWAAGGRRMPARLPAGQPGRRSGRRPAVPGLALLSDPEAPGPRRPARACRDP